MTIRERLGRTGLVLVGAGTLLASFLARPFVPAAMALDSDLDRLTNSFEAAYGTNPNLADSDGDGWSDGYEIFVKGTNPRNADTDGDGTPDNLDATPLDDGNDANGNTVASWTWAENLTAPAWTGTSAVDGKGVYMHSGEFEHSLELLRIDPGYGPSMDLTIHYRSGISYDGPVGNNWTWLSGLSEQGNGDVWVNVEGVRYVYDPDGLGGYTPPVDAQEWSSLVKHPNGTFTLSNRHGGAWGFGATEEILTDQDRFGNTVTYSYTSGKVSSITDATGHVVTVAWYAGTNRVQSLTDGDGRSVVLTYNHFGQLAKVRTPTASGYPSGRTHQFLYSTGSAAGTLNDNLVRALDPKGQAWLRNEFDQNDRTTKQYLGADYFTFTWNGGTSVMTVVDREGNQREWYVPSQVPGWLKEYSNRDVRASDPAYWQTDFTHDNSLRLVEVEYPRGNGVEWTFDGFNNVTEVRRKTDVDAANSVDDLVDAYTFDTALGHFHLMTSHTDPEGHQTLYTLEDTGGLAYKVVKTITHPTVTYLNPDQTASESLTWNSHGQLVTVTDGEGKERANVYFADEGELGVKKGYLKKQIVDSAAGGLQLTTQWNCTNWGTRTSVTNPRGNTTTYSVNNYDWVSAIAGPSPQGYEITFTRDANGNITQKDVENVDSNNARDASNPWWTTTYAYDILDNCTSRTEEIDASHTRTFGYAYTGNEKLETLTKPEGNEVRWVYDERDLVYSRTRGYGAAEASTDISTFDENRNLVTWEDGRGKEWTSEFDLFDRKVKDVNPLGHYTEYLLDKDSRVTEVKRWEEAGATDVLLAHTKQHFDERGRLYRVERGLKGPSSWAFLATTLTLDRRGLVTAVTDPRSKTTSFTHDGAGRRVGVEDALGNLVATTLDACGNPTLTEETEATGYASARTFSTERDFDALDRLVEERVVSEADPNDVHTTTFALDSLSVLVGREDAEGNATAFTHDGLGRVLEEAVDLGGGESKRRSWGFDRNSRLVSHKDDAENETTWTFNARDLVTAEVYPDAYGKDFTYDLADNLTQWIDPNGTQVDLTYDDANRCTARDIVRGTGVGGTTGETWVYDALDRMTEAQDDDVTVQMTWDSLGRTLTETSGQNPMGQSGKTTSYAYDAAGNVTQVGYPDGSFVVNRDFDDVNRATSFTDGNSASMVSVDFYGPGGRLKKLTFGNSTTSEHGYDGFRWLSDLDHKTSTPTTFAGYDLVRDRVGNLLYEEWSHDAGKGHNYSYDRAYRLTSTLQNCADPSAEYANPGSQSYGNKIHYNLSDDSDRSTVVTTLYNQPPSTVNYTANVTHAYTAIGGTNRSHDNNGNLTDDGTFTYTYDYRNQLLTATRKSNSHVEGTYEYDPLGRRTKKTLYGGASERYFHDGVHEIEEFDGEGTLLRKYVYREDIDSISMMEARDVADVDNDQNTSELVRLYFHLDARTNVARLTGPGQTVVESYELDPYGNIAVFDKNGSAVSSSQVGNPFDFQRRRRDTETGLMYFRARMYHPGTGYWLQRDPLGFEPGANWREFVSSSPCNVVDPLGLEGVTPWRYIKEMADALRQGLNPVTAYQHVRNRLPSVVIKVKIEVRWPVGGSRPGETFNIPCGSTTVVEYYGGPAGVPMMRPD